MANKTVNTRIINKHDTTANWNKATNFIPKAGEIIIYDDVHRIKIGDGKTKVTSLPFSESALDTSITNHINNKNNPHAVTKAQVGLSNVDNTSDASKPISTATQTALDKKADKSALSNYVTTSTLTSTISETVSSINKTIDLLEGEVNTNTTSIQGLTNNLSAKYDKAGGTISGNVSITGSLSTNGSLNIASNQFKNATMSVLGTSKSVLSLNNQMYAENGIVFGGTASAAGLVTRGICGINISTNNTVTKDNLYINYDWDSEGQTSNTYKSNRQVILQAGTIGTHYGNNLYQYAAARGDAVKNYGDAHYASIDALDNKVDKVSGKGLSTNDYTTTEKNKLAGIESGAQVNTVTSVVGKTGAVTLSKADVGLNSVVNAGQTATPTNGSSSYFTAGGAYTLQQAINGKANSSHTHTSSQITDLQDKLDAKANTSHTHTISQITDLQASWDAILKATPTNYITRWPTISEVTNKTNLTISLNGGTTEGTNKFTYNGVTAKNINITPASIGAALASHSHSYLPLSGGTLTGTLTGTTISATSFRGTSMSLTGTISGATIRGTTIYEGSTTLSSKYALKTEIPDGVTASRTGKTLIIS